MPSTDRKMELNKNNHFILSALNLLRHHQNGKNNKSQAKKQNEKKKWIIHFSSEVKKTYKTYEFSLT